jgi:hypothetical protein
MRHFAGRSVVDEEAFLEELKSGIEPLRRRVSVQDEPRYQFTDLLTLS